MPDLAISAGGCFWWLEAVVQPLHRVERVVFGGPTPTPSYETVCSGLSGHAKAVQLFDPYPDSGTQYRSAIFTHSAAQRPEREQVVRELAESRTYPAPIVTQIGAADTVFPAGAYHQSYFANNGYAEQLR